MWLFQNEGIPTVILLRSLLGTFETRDPPLGHRFVICHAVVSSLSCCFTVMFISTSNLHGVNFETAKKCRRWSMCKLYTPKYSHNIHWWVIFIYTCHRHGPCRWVKMVYDMYNSSTFIHIYIYTFWQFLKESIHPGYRTWTTTILHMQLPGTFQTKCCQMFFLERFWNGSCSP